MLTGHPHPGGYKYKGAPSAGKEEIVADGEQAWWDASTMLDPENQWSCGISNARSNDDNAVKLEVHIPLYFKWPFGRCFSFRKLKNQNMVLTKNPYG